MRLLATLAAFLISGIVAATPLHNIVVFGDSLSDNGNFHRFMKYQLPQSPPYYEGSFTNGQVWNEYLIESYFTKNATAHLENYAFGGAGVAEDEEDNALFTLKKEVDTYLLVNKDKARADNLYVIWIGANNYLGLPSDTEKTIGEVNAGIEKNMERLISSGAKHFLILNLPDLGSTPAAVEFDSKELMSQYSTRHNEVLNQTVNRLQLKYADTEWIYFDLASMFDEVIKHPLDNGFTNIDGTCSNSLVNEITKKSLLRMVASTTAKKNPHACDGYLFFDLVHPTALAHKMIAERTRILLDNAGVEFTAD